MDSLQIWEKNSELEIFTSKEPLKNHENDTLLCEFTCIYCIRVALYLMIYYFYKMN